MTFVYVVLCVLAILMASAEIFWLINFYKKLNAPEDKAEILKTGIWMASNAIFILVMIAAIYKQKYIIFTSVLLGLYLITGSFLWYLRMRAEGVSFKLFGREFQFKLSQKS